MMANSGACAQANISCRSHSTTATNHSTTQQQHVGGLNSSSTSAYCQSVLMNQSSMISNHHMHQSSGQQQQQQMCLTRTNNGINGKHIAQDSVRRTFLAPSSNSGWRDDTTNCGPIHMSMQMGAANYLDTAPSEPRPTDTTARRSCYPDSNDDHNQQTDDDHEQSRQFCASNIKTTNSIQTNNNYVHQHQHQLDRSACQQQQTSTNRANQVSHTLNSVTASSKVCSHQHRHRRQLDGSLYHQQEQPQLQSQQLQKQQQQRHQHQSTTNKQTVSGQQLVNGSTGKTTTTQNNNFRPQGQYGGANDFRKQSHCEIEKRRRDKMNQCIAELASVIPSFNNLKNRIDKLSVLRMAVQHIKSSKNQALSTFSSFHLRPSFLSSGNLLKNLILQTVGQDVQDNLFLVISCDRGKVLFVSESVKDVLYYEQKQLIGQSLFDILHKDDVSKIKEQISFMSLSPKEMLVDSKTLQPLKGSKQAMHQSAQDLTTGLTPQPGARRSFFCRMKTGLPSIYNTTTPNDYRTSANSSSSDSGVNSDSSNNTTNSDNNRSQNSHHNSSTRGQNVQSKTNSQHNSESKSNENKVNNDKRKQSSTYHPDRHQIQLRQTTQQRNNNSSNTNCSQHSTENGSTGSFVNSNKQNLDPKLKKLKIFPARKHAKYIVMHCSGYLRSIIMKDDDLSDNDMDEPATENDSSDDEGCANSRTEPNSRRVNCLVAVCRRLPVDRPLKADRPITFTCRYSVDGKFSFVDQRLTIALGYLPQELLGTSHYEYCNPEHYKVVADCHRQSLQKAEPVSSDVYQFKRKNGQYMWLQTRLKSFRNPFTKYIEFLIANHTTAECNEPAHYNERCVQTKFHQDRTGSTGSQSSSPSSSSSLSLPSMGSEKKSSSPSSSSIGSNYSSESWNSKGCIQKMLNTSTRQVERTRRGKNVTQRVMDHYKHDQNASGSSSNFSGDSGLSSNSCPSSRFSGGGNGTEDSGSFSDPPSCSSQSSSNSLASAESLTLKMLSNFIEGTSNRPPIDVINGANNQTPNEIQNSPNCVPQERTTIQETCQTTQPNPQDIYRTDGNMMSDNGPFNEPPINDPNGSNIRASHNCQASMSQTSNTGDYCQSGMVDQTIIGMSGHMYGQTVDDVPGGVPINDYTNMSDEAQGSYGTNDGRDDDGAANLDNMNQFGDSDQLDACNSIMDGDGQASVSISQDPCSRVPIDRQKESFSRDQQQNSHHHHHHHHHQQQQPQQQPVMRSMNLPDLNNIGTNPLLELEIDDDEILEYVAGDTKMSKKAVCVLKGDAGVSGTIYFEQSSTGGPVKVTGEVKGLESGEHGFHIHEFGDTTNGCVSAGPHFNVDPAKHHGGPTSAIRHNGDLGNIVSSSDKKASVCITDSQISLKPGDKLDIVGRSLVVHEKKDDLGQGGNEESLKTGNAGGRLACGVIGLTKA
ncbi:Superoxide dismutase [Cu-Zn] [Fragariocoptes setiger]|uniref:Superoxide dismutase [Cu-Zn] n=1 Tax=Fragariocoptes setiger TaxID=1670756 RepID=A0ABQ7SBL7_9ACAR|nr:Superoxide dismutase [Cu-Zn] [Fragariocoptes setiger]